MSENWEKVLVTPVFHRAELAKFLLAEHEIEAVVLNKKDSNYVVFGSCEVYVPTKDAILARIILDNEISIG